MKNLEEIKKILREYKKELKEKYHVKNIALFGSYVRGEQTPKSDIDILVDFERGKKTFNNYMNLKFYLEKLLNIKVNLVVKGSIKPRYQKYINEDLTYV